MERRHFLASMAAVPLAARESKPNIVFILADDLGYGDLGCYGQKLIATPHIDKLAAEGLRFTDAYTGSTVCAPSRCALMTGLHTGHCRIRGNARTDLLAEDRTIAEVLKESGYRTGLTGKWGLGTAGRSGTPNRKGFDEFFGFLDQGHAHTQYPTQLWENEDEFFLHGNYGAGRKDFAHDLFTNRALSFIDKHKTVPFFLYLAYTIPHANNELTRQTGNGMETPSDDTPYSDKPWPAPDRGFANLVHRLDRDVGRILEQIRKAGLDNDTLVLFCSDNGPHKEGGNDPELFNSNGPLRGIKRALYDGGIRTPLIARWPGVVKPGTTSSDPVAFWDMLPTLAEVAGAKVPAGLDGISFLPALKGARLPARPYLYWEFHERGFHQAVRMGRWKGVRSGNRNAAVELYDLPLDPGEQRNVASQNQREVERIAAIMKDARTDSTLFPVREQ